MEISVLHADDDPEEIERVKSELCAVEGEAAIQLESFSTALAFEKRIEGGENPDAVILDLHFDDEDLSGFDLAGKTRSLFPDVAIIVMTDRERLIAKAIRHGANEFISKKSFPGELRSRIFMTVKTVRERIGLLDAAAQDKAAGGKKRPMVIGQTMKAIANEVEKTVNSAVEAVLVTGESGTGKEVVAELFEAIVGQPFIKLNCGELKPELIEGELFGAVKGAYTGATQTRPGLIEAAHGGWIYLDEIHCLPKSGQTALLRVIENKEVRRLGDLEFKKIDVKVMAASNASLDELVKQDVFRHDLLNRLVEKYIELPPVRERRGEARELIEHFCKISKGGPYEIDDAVLNALVTYDWRKGNVREIRNCIRVMTMNHTGNRLTAISVPSRIWQAIDRKTENDAYEAKDSKEISIGWGGDIPEYPVVESQFLVKYLRRIYQENGRLSVRALGPRIGINRQTASDRLKRLVKEGYMTPDELRRLVGLEFDSEDGNK